MTTSLHVALLRGINVGGKNKVEMPRLRAAFEAAGMTQVSTYINTGNVIFAAAGSPDPRTLEQAIAEEFRLQIPVLLRSHYEMQRTTSAIPDDWVNDSSMKCDVMFLWDDVDSPQLIDDLDRREDIDDVRYVPGALLWKVDRSDLTRSRMTKLVGTKLYRSMTVRNVNTVRKLAVLMDETAG